MRCAGPSQEFFPAGKMAIVSEAPPGTETKPMSDSLTAYNGKWIP